MEGSGGIEPAIMGLGVPYPIPLDYDPENLVTQAGFEPTITGVQDRGARNRYTTAPLFKLTINPLKGDRRREKVAREHGGVNFI